jgi:hypothetical protein
VLGIVGLALSVLYTFYWCMLRAATPRVGERDGRYERDTRPHEGDPRS